MTSQKHKKRSYRYSRASAAVLLVGLAAGAFISCVYDSDQRCEAGQKVYTAGVERCVCADGWALLEGVCVQCRDHEIPGAVGCVCEDGYGAPDSKSPCVQCGEHRISGPNSTCVCEDGYGAPDATSACVECGDHEVTGASGACDCESGYERPAAGEPCVEGTTPPVTGEACTSDAVCSEGSRCDLRASEPYCRVEPIGLNQPCASDADCAGNEASYCDIFVTMSCLVQNCTLSPDDCYPGTECCDLSTFGIPQPLCLAEGACTT